MKLFNSKTEFQFEGIGTHWQIDIYNRISASKQKSLLHKIASLIDEYDKIYSRFRSDSLVTEMAKKKGVYKLPENSSKMIALYHELYELTHHAFTPLIGQVLVDAGYDASYSLIPKELSRPPLWDESFSYNAPNLTMKKAALLDFGAAGKGYLIDLVADLLRKENMNAFCIDAGGDIFYQNKEKSIQVGLEHPTDSTQVIGIANISNQSICASAGNRRRWREFHHIIHPDTLTPVKTIKATWVVARTALLADALATCLFFSPAKTFSNYNFSYVLIHENFSLERSEDFPGEVFTTIQTTKYV